MATFKDDFLREDDYETALAILCSYDYAANASEAVERLLQMKKIITKAPCATHSHSGKR